MNVSIPFTRLSPLTRNEDAEEIAREVLIVSIFERLSYLPDEMVAQFFSNLGCPEVTAIDKIRFWSPWYCDGQRVQLDIHIQCGNVSLLVRAERWDYVRQQDLERLARRLSAGWNEADGIFVSQVILLTVGGLEVYSKNTENQICRVIQTMPDSSDAVKQGWFHLRCRNWFDLYQALKEVDIKHKNSGLTRMCNDIAKIFDAYEIRITPTLWLKDMELESASIGNSIGDFDNWKFLK
jgi:hypothetical protein